MSAQTSKQDLISLALTLGAKNAVVINAQNIQYRPEFRKACQQNYCGFYGKCWMCPPHVGDIDTMIQKAQNYKKAFIYQTVSSLEDSYDIEGMEEAAKAINQLASKLGESAPSFFKDYIQLGAGACHICESCAILEDIPCRFPDKAIASLESYGIAVSELATLCNMNYINGQNTVTYFGGFLFND